SEIKGIEWIRLLYCYPDRITDSLIDVIAQNDKVVKYIDMPIQHISDRILGAMNRRDTRKSIDAVIKKLRERVPGIVLRSTVIVGFPGETKEDFNQL
ncbi:MAG TPA: 30S ribosomal protein S12 methylthiotransferase RimO, partial [Clostridiales bacterium]|nr:30S ribosomal protein S12 methylthiotransferase RimO [Clostridiales bacterium]